MRRARGFTLIEVLAATALFALLGTLLFSVVRGAMDLWTIGERNRELNDRAGAALDLLAEDLRAAWPGLPGAAEQDARFLVAQRADDRGADGTGSFSLLAFSRLCHEQRALDWLRRAGDTPGAEDTASLAAPTDPTQLQPTGGLAEALFMLARAPGDALPSLIRRVRMPLGGKGSLLDEESWVTPAAPARAGIVRDGLQGAEARGAGVWRDGVAIADRVLWFGVQCWGPETTCWESLPTDPATAVPALPVWDSTRGLAPSGAEGFPLALGPASLLDGRDDVFPQRVRLTLVLERDEGNATTGVLAEELSLTGTTLTLASAKLLDDEQRPDFVLVEGEWLGVTAIDGRKLSVTRGARGTRPAQHAAGAKVHTGRRFDRVVELPCGRENWNR